MQQEKQSKATTVALAGRRVDVAGADPPRFPLANVPWVRQRLTKLFVDRHVTALACSAACGADLLALEAAEELGLRRRVILPFAPERFRETSVVDRPGDWGPLFDRIIATVGRARDLVILEELGNGTEAYTASNELILKEGLALVGSAPVLAGSAIAVIVWEGHPRGAEDTTQHFAELARQRGLSVEEVSTRTGR